MTRRKSIKPKAAKSPGQRPLLIDWRAYFKAFCDEHGEPQEVGGRLVFPDGWAYSSSDHRGPEWPPPEDPPALARLLRGYWIGRRREAHGLLLEARADQERLKNLVRGRPGLLTPVDLMNREEMSTPLHTTWLDGKGEEAKVRRTALTLPDLLARSNDRLRELEQLIVEADLELEQIKGTKPCAMQPNVAAG